MPVCAADWSGLSRIPFGFVYTSGCYNHPADPTIQLTLDPAGGCYCLSSQVQPWFSCSLVGTAAHQRSAHGFPTRPTSSPRSCILWVVLQSSLAGLVPSPSTCQLVLHQSLTSMHLLWPEPCTSGYGCLGQHGSPL